MKFFTTLFIELDQTTKTNAKVEALATYFKEAPDADKLWTIALLSHRRPKRTVTTTLLRKWAAEFAEIPLWLFEESYHVVGDLAETIAAVLPPPSHQSEQSLSFWVKYIQALGNLEEAQKHEQVHAAWNQLNHHERFIFNKFITGGFRLGVSQKLMVRALSKATGIEENKLAHRIMGNWTPDTTTFEQLILHDNPLDDISKPYPFYLAYALEDAPDVLGNPEEWSAEWKWDGIRGQLIIRLDRHFLWSRGEELVTDKFPEFGPLVAILPNGTVFDGEILPFKDGQPLPFQSLQTRIGRKNVTKKILDTTPVILKAYDLLEFAGQDWREQPFHLRRNKLVELIQTHPSAQPLLKVSEQIPFDQWETLAQARQKARSLASEGLMLKRKDAPYQAGRKKGDWWKWKVDPLTIDAVMIYAQSGHGRRANLFTDFTFAVWDGEALVPFTKAYSGLTDKEFREITSWVRKNTVDRFGPVRSVKPTFVFEIAFEGINVSTRHKSGVALRFPRIKRWRKDKPIAEANTLDDLKSMLQWYHSH